MKRFLLSVALKRLYVLALVLFPMTTGAQTLDQFGAPPSQEQQVVDWTALVGIEDGRRVEVTTGQERAIRGRYETANADSLVILDDTGRRRRLDRVDVSEVRIGPTHGSGYYAGLGSLLGSVGGLVLGAANAGDSELAGAVPVLGAVLGGIWGTVIGYAIGHSTNGRPWQRVYERPSARAAGVRVAPLLSRTQKGVGVMVVF